MSKTLFEKIIAREIPAAIVYEDDLVLAIRDINPQAPVHVLIFPKRLVPRIAEAATADQPLPALTIWSRYLPGFCGACLAGAGGNRADRGAGGRRRVDVARP